jgi:hypothetical protein
VRRLLPAAYGAHAHAVGDDRAVVYTDGEVLLVGPDAAVYDRQKLRGQVQASAGTPGAAVFATDTALVTARLDGDRLVLERQVFAPRFDVATEMAPLPPDDALDALKKECHLGGLNRRGDREGRWSLELRGVGADRVAAVRERLAALGLTVAAVKPSEA